MGNFSFFPTATPGFSTTEPNAPTVHLEVPHTIILCAVLGVASVVGTFGNTLVLLSIIKFESLKAIPDLFIFSLSLSELVVTVLYQPLKAYQFTHLNEIYANKSYLETSRFFGYCSLIASITNIFGVTVERLISVRFPLKYDLFVTTRRAVVTLICIWIFSVTIGAIMTRGYIPKIYIPAHFILSIVGTVSIYIYISFVAKRLEKAAITQLQNRPTVCREHKAA